MPDTPGREEIRARLAPFAIAVRLHIERLPEDTRIIERTITTREALGALVSCYRATARRVECGPANLFARPMCIAEVGRRIEAFTPANRAVFCAYRDGFMAAETPVRLTVPAYDLGGGASLLLDGNHRAAALWLSGAPFVLSVLTLAGPVDRRMLIDLKYWDGGWRRFFNKSRWGTI